MVAQQLGSGLYGMIQKDPSEHHVLLTFILVFEAAVGLYLPHCAWASLFLDL